jgi:hypothetical protein
LELNELIGADPGCAFALSFCQECSQAARVMLNVADVVEMQLGPGEGDPIKAAGAGQSCFGLSLYALNDF